MDILEILELNRRTAGVQNVHWQDTFFTLKGNPSGIVVSPPFFPRLSRFIGFEVRPSELGITVAVAVPNERDLLNKKRGANYIELLNDPLPVSPEPMPAASLSFAGTLPVQAAQKWQKFEGGKWVSSLVPVYQTPAELRERIEFWAGPIQFYLLLSSSDEQVVPTVSEIRLGLTVPRDPVEYLLNYGLPSHFTIPVPLWRNVMPDAGGLTVVIPPNISPERILNPYLMQSNAIIKAIVRDEFIELSSPAAIAPAVLCFDYKPLVEFAGEIFQVGDLPCVVLSSNRDEENKYRLPGRVTLLTKDGLKSWEAAYQFDLGVSISVLGRESIDVETIVNELYSLINRAETAYVECQPWGGITVINLVPGVEGKSQIQTLPGIKARSFKISLGQLIRGGRFS